MGYTFPNTYSLTVGGGAASSPADLSVVYFGAPLSGKPPTVSAGIRKLFIPKSGMIRAGIIIGWSETTVGTNENIVMAIRKNDTTDYTFATVGTTDTFRSFSNTSLAIPVLAGDFIEFKVTCPTWATNPVDLWIYGSVVLESW
jgi:hypothetical protein